MSLARIVSLAAVCALLYSCADPTGPATGTLRLITSTTGADLDADGYSCRLGDGSSRALGVADTVTWTDIEPGRHTVELTDIASNCTVDGANPRTVNVPGGDTAETTFEITCVALTGDLDIVTSTTGLVPDPDGYTIKLDDNPSDPIGINSLLSYPRLAPGVHSVELGEVAANCTVAGDNPRQVNVVANGLASTTFDVECPFDFASGWNAYSFIVSWNSIELDLVGDLGAEVALEIDSSHRYRLTVYLPGANVTRTGRFSVSGDSVQMTNDDDPGSQPMRGRWFPVGSDMRLKLAAHDLFDTDGDGSKDLVAVDASFTRLATGNLQVTASTTGPDPDPDGYLITVLRRLWSQSIGVNAQVTFPNLIADRYLVELTDIAPNCAVVGDYRRWVDVPEHETGEATFAVECVEITSAMFSRPFLGDFHLANHFDHDLPFQGTDNNGFELTWWGEQTRGIDGHNGYDWDMPEGIPLLAVAEGTVVQALQIPAGSCPTGSKIVEVKHALPNGESVSSMYRHMSRIDVTVGQQVQTGQQVGLSGNTGCSTGPHLHFSVWRHTSTNNGQPTRIDPYGWEGPGSDPWAQHSQGAESIRLWREGEAPSVFRWYSLPPNPVAGTAPVAITFVRWMGYKDDQNPNNEIVELTLDPRYSPGPLYDLTGFRLQNNAGVSFLFPDGFVINEGQPVWIYSGSGQNTATALYWGRSTGAWHNMGDCVHLVRPDGYDMYRLTFGGGCS